MRPDRALIRKLFRRSVEAGLRVDVAARVRVWRVLASLPDETDEDTVRDALRVVLATGPTEGKRFDDIWTSLSAAPDVGGRNSGQPLQGGGGGRDVGNDRRAIAQLILTVRATLGRPGRARFKIAIANGLAGAGVVGFVALYDPDAVSAILRFLVELIWPKELCQPNCITIPITRTLSQSPLLMSLVFAAGAVILVVAASLGTAEFFARRKLRRFRPPPYATGGPIFQAGLVGGPPRRLSEHDLDVVAELLLYAPVDRDEDRIDVAASIERTVRAGGLAEVMHPERARVVSVLLLEDAWSTGRLWNPIAAELAEGLDRRGVVSRRMPFFGTFAGRGPGEADATFTEALDLIEDMSPVIVFVVTDGAHVRGRHVRHLRVLRERAPTLWLDHRDASLWDDVLSVPMTADVPVVEASARGLIAALMALSQDEPASATERPRDAPPFHADPVRRAMARLGPARAWAEDCALIQPIGAGLAEAIRARFHPQVDPLCFGRMTSLEGASVGAAGLVFPPFVEKRLAEGFRRRDPVKRREVAKTVGDAVRAEETELLSVVTDKMDVLCREAAAWTRLRAELLAEVNAETRAAIERLVQPQGVLRSAVRAELRRLTRSDEDGPAVIPLAEFGDRDDARALIGDVDQRETFPDRKFYYLQSIGVPAALPGAPDRTVGATLADNSVLIASVSEGRAVIKLFGDDGVERQTVELSDDISLPAALGANGKMALLVEILNDEVARLNAYAIVESPERQIEADRQRRLDATLRYRPGRTRSYVVVVDEAGATALCAAVGENEVVVVTDRGDGEYGTRTMEAEGLIDVTTAADGSGFVVAFADSRLELWRSRERPDEDSGESTLEREQIPAGLGPIERLVPWIASGKGEIDNALVGVVPKRGGLVAVLPGSAARSVLRPAGALRADRTEAAKAIRMTPDGDAVAVVGADCSFAMVDLDTGFDALLTRSDTPNAMPPLPTTRPPGEGARRLLAYAGRSMATARPLAAGSVVELFTPLTDGSRQASNRTGGDA